jgi:predicted helicase
MYPIRQYKQELEKIIQFGGSRNESSIRRAFAALLNHYAAAQNLILVEELSIKTTKGNAIRFDGVLKDILRSDWGFWEAKDESDDLDKEMEKKFAKGYPSTNILFEDSQTAVLVQGGAEVMRASMEDEKRLDTLLQAFVKYELPEIKDFRTAIELFKNDVPRVAEVLREKLLAQETENPHFKKVRDAFWDLCQQSINPEITKEDIQEMIIQHILTEDIFNTIFDETQFHRENNIARELEKVIATFFVKNVRRETLGKIQHYYLTIKAKASQIADHHEKQKVLKVIFENFYKAYNPKGADRLGIVYTPNEIVKFMIESTNYLLYKHFDKYLEDKGVEILDPAVGTGTYVCDIIDFIRKEKIAYKYKHEIHANEVAILPYYIANLNIEYTYKQKTGEYAEFENLCFVDTLDNVGFSFKGKQTDMFGGTSAENAERIKRQNDRKISVIIGNPPYNAKQENFNNQNANRLYKTIDERIRDTYIKHGTAQNQIVVYDMYTRFYRWAMDRLGEDGVISMITNRSFIDSRAFDGFRKCIQEDFSHCYIIDTKSDVRTNPNIAGTTHNVFGIQTGVAIMFLIKKAKDNDQRCKIHYVEMQDEWRKEDKLKWFANNPLQKIDFEYIRPDIKNNWINLTDNDFDSLLPLIDKEVKSGKGENAIFKLFSRGIATQRDEWMYDFSKENLSKKVKYFTEIYQKTLENPNFEDKFLIKWDRELESYLKREVVKDFDNEHIIKATYRPFTKKWFYFDRHFNGMTYQWFDIYLEEKQKIIVIPGLSSPKTFHLYVIDKIIDLNALPAGCQCLPFYRLDKNGEKVENISDWALSQFQTHYQNDKIEKEAIFHYVYAVLHNPAYRQKYELNLKRDFPRIPFYGDFAKWAAWGKTLMDLHIGYESVAPYPLTVVNQEVPEGKKEKVMLKSDKINGFISLTDYCTLKGIPAEAWEYKLGNRSALEWVLDQYKESNPSDATIRELFNVYKFADYKAQVVDLLLRVCAVSVETMAVVREMGE